ncbi:uncharacterized protein LOC121427901 [Lytechinus variegatus]|uniref:uncharacterized protein LOC121427901 n=1 Tax=Lytechinus variegatus TaxID=7654 RepID=UPI001BB1B300|nr:uncharacterized protein LOC121427901 [Lytechinus variegatus]
MHTPTSSSLTAMIQASRDPGPISAVLTILLLYGFEHPESAGLPLPEAVLGSLTSWTQGLIGVFNSMVVPARFGPLPTCNCIEAIAILGMNLYSFVLRLKMRADVNLIHLDRGSVE